jgi:hypothetical protein
MSLNQRVLSSLSKKSKENIYQQKDSDSSTLSPVLSAVSDNKSLSLFYTIAVANRSDATADGPPPLQQQQPSAEILISRMNLTRKQYYSRIKRLLEAGLIRRKGVRFVLTSLGRIVYETHKTIGFAIHNRWKLHLVYTLTKFLLVISL